MDSMGTVFHLLRSWEAHVFIAMVTAIAVGFLTFKIFFPRKNSFKRDVTASTKTDQYAVFGPTANYFESIQSSFVLKLWFFFAVFCGVAVYFALQNG